MFVDSHAHLYSEQFNEDIFEVLTRAQEMKVNRIFLPNIDSDSISAMKGLAEKYPNLCYPMMGLHPCHVKENFQDELNIVEAELAANKYYGVGETGIDLYWDTNFKKEQITAFEFQIDLSKKYALPIIIHSRESLDLTIELISKHQDGSLTGIFHCFNGTVDQCRKIADMGFMMGLGGVITFKKANLGEMVSYLPEQHLLLETDAPYLSPVPYRGKRNESSYIPLVARKIAEFKNLEVEQIAKITSENSQKLFSY